MKKTCLLSLAAGMACCSIAMAKPPLQKALPGAKLDPIRIAKVKKVNGNIVVDGEWMDYNGAGTRNAALSAPFFDCFGRTGALATNGGPAVVGPGSQCAVACDGHVDANSYRWFFGTAYENPNTLEDMQNCACPPSSSIEEIDMGWYWGPAAATQCYLIYFPVEQVIEFNGTDCTDPNSLTDTGGGGVIIDFGILAPGGGFYYYSVVTGMSSLGVLSPSSGSGGYQMIIAEAITATSIILAAGPTQPMLWGTGDSTAGECRPGFNNEDSYDDDGPTDGTFSNPAECYSYAFGVCPDPLGKDNVFCYLRCPADLNNDGFVDGLDSDLFNNQFEAGNSCADLNGDCFVDGLDSDLFNNEFESACP